METYIVLYFNWSSVRGTYNVNIESCMKNWSDMSCINLQNCFLYAWFRKRIRHPLTRWTTLPRHKLLTKAEHLCNVFKAWTVTLRGISYHKIKISVDEKKLVKDECCGCNDKECNVWWYETWNYDMNCTMVISFCYFLTFSRYGLLESSYVPGYPFSLPFKYELFYAQY